MDQKRHMCIHDNYGQICNNRYDNEHYWRYMIWGFREFPKINRLKISFRTNMMIVINNGPFIVNIVVLI